MDELKPEHFFFNIPIYKKVAITDDNWDDFLYLINFGRGDQRETSVEGYNPFQKQDSTFGGYSSINESIEYYTKYVFEDNEGYCNNCGAIVNIKGTSIRKFCCHKCALSYNNLLYLNSQASHDKAKNTFFDKFGSYPMANKLIKEKRINNNLEKYGVKYTLQLESVKETRRKSNLLKYGVENVSQNLEIHERALRHSYKLKAFRDTNLWYQGSYELDFLEKYYEKYPDIKRGPSIKYEFNGKNKVYHPDFYIPSLNLIVECKCLYRYIKDKSIIDAKEKATIANGFNYQLILDKQLLQS